MSATYLVFGLGEACFAFALDEIKEVCSLPALYHPPGLPPLLAGFVGFGKEFLPVLELAWLLDQPLNAHRIDQHLILLRRRPLFCLVERVLDILPLPEPQPMPAGHTFNNWAAGVLSYQEQTCFLLEPERLLLSEERQRLSSLQEMARVRLEQLEMPNDAGSETANRYEPPVPSKNSP